MTDYVLVHGGNMPTDAWNKMVQKEEYPPGEYMGGKIWDKTGFSFWCAKFVPNNYLLYYEKIC